MGFFLGKVYLCLPDVGLYFFILCLVKNQEFTYGFFLVVFYAWYYHFSVKLKLEKLLGLIPGSGLPCRLCNVLPVSALAPSEYSGFLSQCQKYAKPGVRLNVYS